MTDKPKNIAMTGTVSPELREAIEAHRWPNRLTVTDVVREALEEWAAKRNIAPTTTAKAPK